MKYIRQAKNTKLKGKLPDEFVTEVVEESLYNTKHEKLGGWEKVSNAKCKELCDNNDSLMEAFNKEKDEARKLREQEVESTESEMKTEFEEFLAWKRAQNRE